MRVMRLNQVLRTRVMKSVWSIESARSGSSHAHQGQAKGQCAGQSHPASILSTIGFLAMPPPLGGALLASPDMYRDRKHLLRINP
jgi:hypothetical protein